jgi:hypothetical protein
MKGIEFEKYCKCFELGDTLKIRYFTFDKNQYIDIVGEFNGIVEYNHRYGITFSEFFIEKFHPGFTGKNCPEIKGIFFYDNISIIVENYDRVIKLNRIKNKIKENESKIS